jgi:hypothetical protein
VAFAPGDGAVLAACPVSAELRADPGAVGERSGFVAAAAVEALAAGEEVERALAQATERLKQDMSEEAFDEQQRLIAAQQGLKQRLASLAGTD